MDIEYFRTIHHSAGVSNRNELTIREAKTRLYSELQRSINYKANATRNGIAQPMCLVPTDVRYKCQFICLPNDDIFPGDIIVVDGQVWLVIESNNTNPLQKIGMAWLCNHQFSFQNWSSNVIHRWGVLDSGVYSTTLNGNAQVQETDKQFKIYLPYDEDTKKIYIDKRFAVDTRFDATGKEILECYKVTGLNHVARSYGHGAHLLILEIRSDHYSETRDNKDLLLCDYIAPTVGVQLDEQAGSHSIVGRNTIPIGMSRKYTISGCSQDFIPVVWEIENSVDGIEITGDGYSATISVDDKISLIGDVITISAKCADESVVLRKEVEVTA